MGGRVRKILEGLSDKNEGTDISSIETPVRGFLKRGKEERKRIVTSVGGGKVSPVDEQYKKGKKYTSYDGSFSFVVKKFNSDGTVVILDVDLGKELNVEVGDLELMNPKLSKE